jgi:hypothetical protein
VVGHGRRILQRAAILQVRRNPRCSKGVVTHKCLDR